MDNSIHTDRLVRFFVLALRFMEWCHVKTGVSLKECWHKANIAHMRRKVSASLLKMGADRGLVADAENKRAQPRLEKFSGLKKRLVRSEVKNPLFKK